MRIRSKLGTCFNKAIVIIYIIWSYSYLNVLIYAGMERNDLNTHDIQEWLCITIYLPQDCTTCYMIQSSKVISCWLERRSYTPLWGLKQNRIDTSTLLPIIWLFRFAFPASFTRPSLPLDAFSLLKQGLSLLSIQAQLRKLQSLYQHPST